MATFTTLSEKIKALGDHYAIYADKFNELSINSTEELKQRVGGDRVALF